MSESWYWVVAAYLRASPGHAIPVWEKLYVVLEEVRIGLLSVSARKCQ